MEFTAAPRRFDAPVFRWFAPPKLPTPDSTRRAHRFWLLAWRFFAVVTITLGIAGALEPDTLLRRSVTIAAVGILVAGLHEINRRGQTVLASWMLVMGLTLIVTQRAWNTGGIHAPVAVFYTLFILMAGALLGARASVATAIVCVCGAMFLTIAEQVGWLTVASTRPPAGAFMFVMLTIGLALLVQTLITPRPRGTARIGDDMVQMAVHDMQSPIQVMLANLSLLREDAPGEMADRVDDAIGGAKSLARQASNLLDVNRIAARRMPIARKPTDVAAVARDVVISLAVLAPGSVIEVTGNSIAMARCDADLLRRILENLVSNAIKHSPPGGRVWIDVTLPPGAGHVRLAVQDEGTGIRQEVRRRIFEKFGSASLRTESGYPSTGLGLAFCKLAVESHGGTIRVEDAVPHGSVFIVELPV